MFRRRGKKVVVGTVVYQDVKLSVIEAYLEKYSYESKLDLLEIGNIKNDIFTTVDIRPDADYVGDIRGMITNDYEASDSLKLLPIGHFKMVKLINTVEHIQWIYQDALINWLNTLLSEGGMLYIETPNLEYIAKVYLKNVTAMKKGDPVRFPPQEYPGMADERGRLLDPEADLPRWVQFKFFSGCSPGDFHHCCYDARWLGQLLDNAGFEKIRICSDDTLKAIAFKAGNKDSIPLDDAINRATAWEGGA